MKRQFSSKASGCGLYGNVTWTIPLSFKLLKGNLQKSTWEARAVCMPLHCILVRKSEKNTSKNVQHGQEKKNTKNNIKKLPSFYLEKIIQNILNLYCILARKNKTNTSKTVCISRKKTQKNNI